MPSSRGRSGGLWVVGMMGGEGGVCWAQGSRGEEQLANCIDMGPVVLAVLLPLVSQGPETLPSSVVYRFSFVCCCHVCAPRRARTRRWLPGCLGLCVCNGQSKPYPCRCRTELGLAATRPPSTPATGQAELVRLRPGSHLNCAHLVGLCV